jgi:hypothetical protein
LFLERPPSDLETSASLIRNQSKTNDLNILNIRSFFWNSGSKPEEHEGVPGRSETLRGKN